MPNCKVSVIIPVYNVELYLSECLDSILNQTYNNLEIICIDDCSSDNSLSILQDYAKKDLRIKIIHNIRNLGVAVSRNIGINSSHGQYICFLDSDDVIQSRAIETMLDDAVKKGSDVVVTRSIAFTSSDDENEKLRVQRISEGLTIRVKKEMKVNSSNFLEPIDYISCIPCGKLFKLEFVKNNDIKFIASKFIHEDMGFWIKLCSMSPLITFPNKSYVSFFYRQRPSSITTNPNNRKIEFNHIKAVIYDALKYIKNHHSKFEYKEYKNELKKSRIYYKYFQRESNFLGKLTNIFSVKNQYIDDKKYKILTMLGIRIKHRIRVSS